MQTHGLDEVVVGAERQRADRRAFVASRRHDDHRDLGDLAQVAEHIESIAILETEVEEHRLCVSVTEEHIAAA